MIPDFDPTKPIGHTVALIKPDAVHQGIAGTIYALAEKEGLVIGDLILAPWTYDFAQEFYAEHKGRPYYAELIQFMLSGPIVTSTLVGYDAIKKWRKLMGATDPAKAETGTVRAQFGSKDGRIMYNCVHGSDSEESVEREVAVIKKHTTNPHFGRATQYMARYIDLRT